jgi:hypothetical protein
MIKDAAQLHILGTAAQSSRHLRLARLEAYDRGLHQVSAACDHIDRRRRRAICKRSIDSLQADEVQPCRVAPRRAGKGCTGQRPGCNPAGGLQ